MDPTLDAIIKGLFQAISAERDGQHFYLMAARTTKDPQGQHILEQLANEEREHQEFLHQQYRALMANGLPDASVKLSRPLDLKGDCPIFSPAIKDRLTEAHFEMSALSVGIQLELSAMTFYQTTAERAAVPAIRDFFQELAQWENGHYQALLRQQLALKDDYWSQSGFSPF